MKKQQISRLLATIPIIFLFLGFGIGYLAFKDVPNERLEGIAFIEQPDTPYTSFLVNGKEVIKFDCEGKIYVEEKETTEWKQVCNSLKYFVKGAC